MEFSPMPQSMLTPCDKPGKLVRFYYDSETYDGDHTPIRKDALVYLPYGYDEHPEQHYPVLYLMHGGGGNSDEFFGGLEARTGLKNLLDHSIAMGRAKPMLVIAPSYLVPEREEARHNIAIAQQLTHRFPIELKLDLLPAVSDAFRVIAAPEARAFGGFSMGGETTWSVLSQCAKVIRTYLPLSGDYWAMGLKGGKDFPVETAEVLIRQLRDLGAAPNDVQIMAFTGDRDIAYEALDPMIHALAQRTDFFSYADTPDGGNLTYCLKPEGWHTYDACFEYLYLAMPWLFR